MGRKKDDKPIPPMGPGSKVVALTPQLRRHITQRMTGRKKNIKAFDMSFSTILMKKLPEEIFKNEELVEHARRFEAPNNRLKKMPKQVGVWTELEHFDVHHNQLKRFVARGVYPPTANEAFPHFRRLSPNQKFTTTSVTSRGSVAQPHSVHACLS